MLSVEECSHYFHFCGVSLWLMSPPKLTHWLLNEKSDVIHQQSISIFYKWGMPAS